MIQFVAVVTADGSTLKLPLSQLSEPGLYVKSVEGLGPAEAQINTTDISSGDGSVFNSSRVGARNIVLTLGFVDDPAQGYSVESARLATYRYFPVKQPVTFYVKTDNRYAAITGYVESNEPNIFTDESETQISLVCPSPYFVSVDANATTSFSAISGGFEFAFSNEDLSEKLLKFATLRILYEQSMVYSGDTATGFKIRIHASSPATNPMIVKTSTGASMSLDTSKFGDIVGDGVSNMVAGDDIVLDTRLGSKTATLIRNAKTYNIVNCLSKNVRWLQITQGANSFSYRADAGGSALGVIFEYNTLYVGV